MTHVTSAEIVSQRSSADRARIQLSRAACVVFFGLALASMVIRPLYAQGGVAPMVVDLPLQGIKIDSDADGNWSRIYSTGTQPVEFPDRRGISTAQKIAEERAKAQIVKFLQQEVSTETVASEMETTGSTTTSRKGTGADGISKEAQRKLATSLTEVMRSYSKGTLRGVTVLEVGYDEKREEAWVRVGVSQETMGIARSVQTGRQANQPAPIPAAAGGRREEVVRQPSEVRTGNDLPPSWRAFTTARGLVRGLHLRSRAEWDAYCASSDKPKDVPSNPDVVYRERGWISWDDWLGIGG